MKLTVKIDSPNMGKRTPNHEIADILHEIAIKIRQGLSSGDKCLDSHDNKVGDWSFKP